MIVFIGAAFACGLVASLMRKLISSVGLGPVDRSLGAVFGVVRAGVLLLAATVVIETTGLKDMPWWQASQSAPLLRGGLAALKPVLPDVLVRFLPQ